METWRRGWGDCFSVGVTAPPPMLTAIVRGSEVQGPALGSQTPSAGEEVPVDGDPPPADGGMAFSLTSLESEHPFAQPLIQALKKDRGKCEDDEMVPAVFNNHVETRTWIALHVRSSVPLEIPPQHLIHQNNSLYSAPRCGGISHLARGHVRSTGRVPLRPRAAWVLLPEPR